MSERLRSASARTETNPIKMESDLGTRKTLIVLVIVVGCFAVLWPKVFYPMLVASSNQQMKPNSLDKGCCDVISDIDVNTIKIMSELCNNMIQQDSEKPLRGQEIIVKCRTEVLSKCGIDISAVLQEQVRLGRSFKQIVDELRSFNGSLCLKYNFGVSPWSLGVSHRVTFNVLPVYVRQERPTHLRPEMLHPALREKGRAIAHPYSQAGKGSQPKFVDGRPGPVPGIRPPMGAGAGHIVGQQQKGLNSMGVIMPIYTVGIVIFFSYTLMKILFKKKPEGPGAPLYPPVEPSTTFRNEVFEAVKNKPPRHPTSRDEEMDHLRRRLRETEFAMERIVAQMAQVPLRSQKEPNGTLANGTAKQPEPDQPSVKVLGMEVTASCEGGEKWSRPESPVIPNTPPPPPEPVEPPQEIYLEGALPAQSQLLVADSTTEEEEADESSTADPAVVLASKMTLSVISVESPEDNIEEKSKLRNGNLVDAAHESLDDEMIDESKYTTASGATAAEDDYSEEEQTDDEGNLQEDIEKLPECTVDNGVQQVEDDDALQDEEEIEIDEEEIAEEHKEDARVDEKVEEIEEEEEEVEEEEEMDEVEEKEHIRIDKEEKEYAELDEEEKEDVDEEVKEDVELDEEIEAPEERQSSIRILVEPADPVSRQDEISAEDVQSIGDVIDDVISAGTRMSELISAKKENNIEDEENEE